MKGKIVGLALVALVMTLSGCDKSPADIRSTASGDVVGDITASGRGGAFDGKVDDISDLDDIVETAWGEGRLGLHRGHMPIQNVLEAFLGINHDEMHVLMEQAGLNLAATSRHLGFDPDNLVESLTASFSPFIEQGVQNGVITDAEAAEWKEKVRATFRKRVYWEG